MNNAIIRPEKITKFLSYMFPTERDRLYFEMVRESVGVSDTVKYGRWVSEISYEPSRIELEMPTNAYIVKYNSLRKRFLYNDSNTPDEIHADVVITNTSVNVDMCNTTKTKTQQLNFINRLYGATTKINKDEKEKQLNKNSYIFAVNKSLCKNNSLFKTYSLTDYNDENYTFTDEDIKEYSSYLKSTISNIENIRKEIRSIKLEQVIDVYLQQ